MPCGSRLPTLPLISPLPSLSSPLTTIFSLFAFTFGTLPSGLWALHYSSSQQQQPNQAQQLSQLLASSLSHQQNPLFSTPTRISHFDPILKAKSTDGYLPESAGHGTFVRTAPSAHASPLQILVEDRDLLPGMPSAVYQYILTGYGAERFAVDQQGNLYLNMDELDLESTGTQSFVLHVIAREVATSPTRSSPPISLTIHVVDDEQIAESAPPPQSIYIANVSALDVGERVIAQVKAREGEGSGSISYRIMEVSDGASNSFHYDNKNNELKVVGPLYPGHRYKVVIEARDAQGLVGHAVVLVQAMPPSSASPSSSPSPAFSQYPTDQPPSAFWPANSPPPPPPPTNSFWPSHPPAPEITPLMMFTTTLPSPPNTVHPTEQNVFVELSEATPIGSIVTILGNEESKGKVHFVVKGGNEEGKFTVEEQMGTVITRDTFDREHAAEYTLRIESRSRRGSTDQLLYITFLHVDVSDVNDNAPQFVGPHPALLTLQLDELSINNTPNLLVGHIDVVDPDKGQNGKLSLSVMSPLDRLFSISDDGQVRVNGPLSSAHLGKHQLAIRAVDHGDPPLESRAVIGVRISAQFASSIRETLFLGGLPPPLGGPSVSSHARPSFGSLGVSSSASGSVPVSSSDYEAGFEAEPSEAGKGMTEHLQELPRPGPDHGNNLVPFTRVHPQLGGAPSPLFPLSTLPPSTISPSTKGSISKQQSLFSTTSAPLDIRPSSSSEEMSSPRLAPIFDSAEIKVFVEENEEQMELTRLRAHYPDGGPGPITYQLQIGDESVFSVDPNSGAVTLLRALDAESERQPPLYRIKLGTVESTQDEFVLDPGLAHSCEMTVHVVDINDWIPNFEQQRYEFTIPETTHKGTVIGQITAIDQDLTAPNNKIHYELVSNTSIEADRLVQIDAESGKIVLSAGSLANFAGKKLEYTARATDGGLEGTEQNSTTDVVIRVERNLGETSTQRPIEGAEHVEEGSKQAAEQQHGQKNNYNIEYARSTSTTAAWSWTGTSMPSSSPAPPSLARHHGDDMHFVARNFNTTIAEGQRPPVLVRTLPVEHKPQDTRFTMCAIRSGNLRGAFSVAPNSRGDCELRTQVQLDREAVAAYQLNVSVQNGAQIDSAMVGVAVLDVNDNKPKFVFSADDEISDTAASGGSSTRSYFTVLPIESSANVEFFAVMARDLDSMENGNGAVTYEIVEESEVPNGDAAFFDINSKTGALAPRKKASEVAQLSRKDYFRITVMACDSPATEKRLCSRLLVAVSLLGDQHRFALVFVGANGDQIRQKEEEIAKSIRPFAGSCSWTKIQKVNERSTEDGGQMITIAVMYAANRKEQRLCPKSDFRELFTAGAKQRMAGEMRQWGVELLEVMGEMEPGEGGRTASRRGADGVGQEAGGEQSTLWPPDWNSAATVFFAIALTVALVALFGLCALFAFRTRHQQMRRRRAEQMRRRHRGFSTAGAGLLALGRHNKGPTIAHLGGAPLFASAIPSYTDSTSNNLYLPTTPTRNASVGVQGQAQFERANKPYESQLLELPLVDDDYTEQSANGRREGHGGQMAPNGGRGVARQQVAAISNCSFSPPRRQFSDLLPLPPQAQRHQLRNIGNGRAADNGAADLRQYSLPQATNCAHQQQEGDFSIDESFYVASGQQQQSRCIY